MAHPAMRRAPTRAATAGHRGRRGVRAFLLLVVDGHLAGFQQRVALHDADIAGEDGDAVCVAHLELVALDLDRLVALELETGEIARPLLRQRAARQERKADAEAGGNPN